MEQELNIHIGIRLKQKRIEKNLTQTKVAKALNVTFQQIQKYEKGTNGLSASRMQALSNYFKVPISYFFEGFTEFKEEFNLENNRINIEFLNKLITSLSTEYRQKLIELIKDNKNENDQNSIAINSEII
jgi:transcriptional regulator with XRE-family HTH domain